MRTAKRVFPLLWLCMLVLMLAFLPAAFAAFGPSRTDLEEINSQIEYPKNDEYWDNYAYGTVVAPKGHSVYCYGSADRKGSQYTVLDGEEVTILASRGDMLCVIIPSQNRGRWIKEEHVDIYQGGENRTSQHITIEIRSGSPGKKDLEEINSQIEYPKSGEYWDNYGYGFVAAPKGHSVYCYGSADRQGSQYTVLDGEQVIVLASRGDMLCVIIPSQDRGRWIKEEYVNIFFGETKTRRNSSPAVKTGTPSETDLKEINSQIEYPKSNEYWDYYAYGTVTAPKGHSVYCYGSADRQGSQYTVLDGEEVVVLASRGDMLCVIIPSQNRGRWIKEEHVDLY